MHKQFSIQPDPTYLSTLKICRVGLHFYAINPTLFHCFLLICYPLIHVITLFDAEVVRVMLDSDEGVVGLQNLFSVL